LIILNTDLWTRTLKEAAIALKKQYGKRKKEGIAHHTLTDHTSISSSKIVRKREKLKFAL